MTFNNFLSAVLTILTVLSCRCDPDDDKDNQTKILSETKTAITDTLKVK